MNQPNIDEFLHEQNRNMEALYKPVLLNHWMAATTGEKVWSEKHEVALNQYFENFSDTNTFQKVVSLKEDNTLSATEKRQIDDLYNKMITNQLDRNIRQQTLQLENEISQTFTTYRPMLKGEEVSNNDLLQILQKSKDDSEQKEAWLATKQVGKKIEETLLKLVIKRNEDARALGFSNFYEMSFKTQELDIDTVFRTFQELVDLSDESYLKVKNEIDEERAEFCGIKVEDLRPWHYVDPFFQEAPPVSGLDLDTFYEGKDLEDIAKNTFETIGLDVEDILRNSDLYPRENKNPFGFCTNIDRKGNIRILVNLNSSTYWATALLHELGHAVYYKYIDKELPFILRFQSHTITTEAIALFFGRQTKMVEWQQRFLGLNEKQVSELKPAMDKMLTRQMVVAARWIITFAFFERELYENPHQDLNKLWWDLVKKIQCMNPPEDTSHPDWASKMHFSLAPVSYQNYLLGELMASQLHHFIDKYVSNDLYHPKVGDYLKNEFFNSGATLQSNEKIKSATGEYLNPVYFVRQFLKG
ncbi:M3 family metallopeptidase [Litchfieldia sinesaloumensis]|uniref:M3 family metallopeptidase n=1 Tax=Litchfieldia sinesaloumensis TaxID=1926280 RepID=UPI000988412C|nr:M3 family metallopeptidase [Bacillus sinesaloumensis]